MTPIEFIQASRSLSSPCSFIDLMKKLKNTHSSRDAQKQIQSLLNQGLKVQKEEVGLLQSLGYNISYNPQTIEKFHNFIFPGDEELTRLIQTATPETGLLVDRYKMYRPGPATTPDSAKGYGEIFAIFEQQTDEKIRIAEDSLSWIEEIEKQLPKEHPWQGPKTLIDLGCGNGVQEQELLKRRPDLKLIGIDNDQGCIDNSKIRLPNQHFYLQSIFSDPPPEAQGNILFLSHFYCREEQVETLMTQLKKYRKDNDTLLIFTNGDQGTDADILANTLPFLRGKTSSSMSEDFQRGLIRHNYRFIDQIKQAKVTFPSLTAELRQELLQIQRGDYENPYSKSSQPFKTFKALMEFIASFPLESMTQEEIASYLDALEEKFQHNQGPFLKISNRIVFAYHKKSSPSFQTAIEKAQKQRDLDSQFQEIEYKLTQYVFREGKKQLANLLKHLSESCNNPQHSEEMPLPIPKQTSLLKGFNLLSDFYLAEEKYPEAIAILWYAKTFTDKEDHITLDKKITSCEKKLLQQATKKEEGPLSDRAHKEQLTHIREQIQQEYSKIKQIPDQKERALAIHILYKETITPKIKEFIAALINSTIKQLHDWGKPLPCSYAIIGLGSLALEEMTPYSDFEFAILLDPDAKKEDKPYFLLLNDLFHLRILNLGETILPSLHLPYMEWLYDDITPRGLCFDGSMPTASKTAKGRFQETQWDYDLIHSPETMLTFQYQEKETTEEEKLWSLKRYHLPTILASVTFVAGNPDLEQTYTQQVHQTLSLELGKKRALHLMEDDLLHWKPHLAEVEHSGKNYNVKKDLYRLPNTMLDGLANYYALKARSSWERIEELEQRKILNPQAAQDLKIFIALANELRLATYLKHNRQKEHLELEEHQELIFSLYQRAVPFTQTMEAFCLALKQEKTEEEATTILQKAERFYDSSHYTQALYHFRHMQYLKAEEHFAQSDKTIDPTLAALKEILGKYPEAEQIYKHILQPHQPIAETLPLYQEIAKVQQKQGHYSQAEQTLKTAEQHLHQQLKSIINTSQDWDSTTYVKLLKTLYTIYQEQKERKGVLSHPLMYKNELTPFLPEEFIADLFQQMTDTKIVQKTFQTLSTHLLLSERLYLSLTHFYKEIGQYEPMRTYLKGCQRLAHLRLREKKPDVTSQVIVDLDLAELRQLEAIIAEKINSAFEEAATKLKEARLILRAHYQNDHHPKLLFLPTTISNNLEKIETSNVVKKKQEILKLEIRLFGEEHPAVATSLNNVGLTFGALGDHKKALEYQQKALEIGRRLFGEEHPAVATSLNNVGSTFGALGDHKKALEYQQKAIEIGRRLFGEEHPDVATLLNNMGGTFGALGDHKKALEYQKKSLEIRRRLFGKEHPDVAASLANVGGTFGALGDHKKALEYQQKALEIATCLFGEEHPAVAASLNNVGFTFGTLGDHKKAFEYQQKALEIATCLFGEEHPDVATGLNNVGVTFGALGDHKKALEYQQKALEIRRRLLGEEHPAAAGSLNNVGFTFGAFGNHKKALEYKQKALEIQRRLFGEEHPDVATGLNNVGSTFGALGDHKKALEYQQKALEIQRRLFGEEHPDVAASLNNLGSAFGALGDHKKALEYLQKALEIQRRLFGEEHPDVAISLNNVGGAFGALGDHKKALEYQQKALEIRRCLLGSFHPDTIASEYNLAGELSHLKRYPEANEHLQNARQAEQKNGLASLWHEKRKQIDEMIQEGKSNQVWSILDTLPKDLKKEDPEVMGYRIHLGFLLNKGRVVKQMETLLQEGKELSIKTGDVHLMTILAFYALSRNDWKTLLALSIQLKQVANECKEIFFCYRKIDCLAFKEELSFLYEEIPMEILWRYFSIKAMQGQGAAACILPRLAQELVKKTEESNSKGSKIEEIKIFCYQLAGLT